MNIIFLFIILGIIIFSFSYLFFLLEKYYEIPEKEYFRKSIGVRNIVYSIGLIIFLTLLFIRLIDKIFS